MEFAINEALESGRQSAMPAFLEMELREKIAQEIEEYKNSWNHNEENEYPCIICNVVNKIIDIARGKK